MKKKNENKRGADGSKLRQAMPNSTILVIYAYVRFNGHRYNVIHANCLVSMNGAMPLLGQICAGLVAGLRMAPSSLVSFFDIRNRPPLLSCIIGNQFGQER